MARNKYDIDETLESEFNIKHLLRAGAYLRPHGKQLFLAAFLSAVAVILGLITAPVFRRALDVTIPNSDKTELYILSAVLLLCTFLSVRLGVLRSRLMIRIGQGVIRDIRRDLFNHLMRLPFEFYDNRPNGKIYVRVVNYVNSVSDTLSNGILNLLIESMSILFIIGFMLATDVRLTLIVLCGVPVLLFILLKIKPAQRKSWQLVSACSSNINAYLQESIDGARVTQSFVREDENAGILDKLAQRYRKVWMRAIYTSQLVWYSVENISVTVVGGMYIVGLLVLGVDSVSFGTLIAMSNLTWRFWQPITNLANLYNNFINAIAYLERIFEMLDEPVTISDAPDAGELPPIQGRVSFENVTFAYDNGRNVLENLSFEVEPGESVALVGPTGAGKTTIVNLLSRFYDISSGCIKIDGTDISRVTLESLRSQMGIMLQDCFLFSGTLRDNISYGKLDASDEEIKRAAETVCAGEFLNYKGLDTELSERGGGLSAGQKQLISFARTLLSDPRILILDEATSSIDAKTERDLQLGLSRMLKGRTSFIIAHRLSTIRSCDKVMYIDRGGITECGTHDELLEKRGDYYRLYTAQNE